MFHIFFDTSEDFSFELCRMCRLIEKSKEIFLEKNLKLSIIYDFYSRCSWLIRDECRFSKKCTRTKKCNLVSSTNNADMSRIDIVGTSVGDVPYCQYCFTFFTVLRLAHEEKIGNFFFCKALKYVEIFNR